MAKGQAVIDGQTQAVTDRHAEKTTNKHKQQTTHTDTRKRARWQTQTNRGKHAKAGSQKDWQTDVQTRAATYTKMPPNKAPDIVALWLQGAGGKRDRRGLPNRFQQHNQPRKQSGSWTGRHTQANAIEQSGGRRQECTQPETHTETKGSTYIDEKKHASVYTRREINMETNK